MRSSVHGCLQSEIWNLSQALKSVRGVLAARGCDNFVVKYLTTENVIHREDRSGVHECSVEEALSVPAISKHL